MINRIVLKNFKKVKEFDITLERINILVGANNSGKSSVLQGIQFSIMSEVTRRYLNSDSTIPQEKLFYSPASDFVLLRNGNPYTNYSGKTSELSLFNDSNPQEYFTITLKKGRNHGNISIQTTSNNKFRQTVTSFTNLYSAYTPGLSGIPKNERLVGKAVLRNAAANGDANLFLRNIIYYISQENNLGVLNDLINNIFSDVELIVKFNPENEVDICVLINNKEQELPIELCGTGLLQIIQIMAYYIYFKPKLLLLDEPDEHLHPNNQILLCRALEILCEKYLDLQIILSTHSRHIISTLNKSAKFIWMKDGTVCQEKINNDLYNLLLDLGALDSFDEVLSGKYKNVVLTEDSDIKYMKQLLASNSVNLDRTLIYSYKTCSQIESAILVGELIKRESPDCKIIIHRDGDFMTKDEEETIKKKIVQSKLIPWITDYSDIEAYFVTVKHLSMVTGKTEKEIQDWINIILTDNHVEIQNCFSEKRIEIKKMLYFDEKLKTNLDVHFPSTLSLFGKDVPTKNENVKGKYLLKKINGMANSYLGKDINILQHSDALIFKNIKDLFK